MLSTTVEPECPQRPVGYSAAHTVGSWTTIGAAAGGALAREATKALTRATIQPSADRVEVYGVAARAISPAVN
jgi:hypothetical protein